MTAFDWSQVSRETQLAIIEQDTGQLKKVSNTRGGEYGHCPCPKCGGDDRFFVQFEGAQLVWFCRKHNEQGGDLIDYLKDVQNKTYAEAVAMLGAAAPTGTADHAASVFVQSPANGNGHKNGKAHREPVATFYYSNTLRVQRYNEPKEYIPEHLEGDRWVLGIGDRANWPLYNAFEIEIATPDEWILFTEGEKTCEALKPLGFAITCIQGGAKIAKSHWQEHYTAALAGRKVAILRDQDKDGHSFGLHVKEHLAGHAAEVRIIDLPGLQYRESHGEDPENWRERGGTTAELQKILYAPPEMTLSLPWLTLDQVEAMPDIEYLIPEVLPKQSLALVFGPPESGKSFLVLDWAASLACEGQSVLYVATEGQHGQKQRSQAWKQHHNQQIPPDKLLQMHEAVNLLDDDRMISLLNDAAILRPSLIVFDTLANMLAIAGCEENSASDMGRFLMACNRLQREIGCTVLLVHHTTKAGQWERGSGALRGACDMIVEVTNADSYVTVSCSKSKDAAPFKDRHYQLMPVADSCVLVETDKVIYRTDRPLTENESKALEVLGWPNFIDVGAKSSIIAREAHIPEGSIIRVLGSLMKRDLVTQEKRGEPYKLTEIGKQRARAQGA